MIEQVTLPGIDKHFLSARLRESRRLVRKVVRLSGDRPLILQFSGGRDSMAMLGLVREVTDNLVCAYMATGLEFRGVVQFVKKTCAQLGVKLIISNPSMHKGNIFKRVERFQGWPGLIATWCCRDLKLRPERKLLVKLYGKGTFYKLEGVRRAESSRRMQIYKPYTGNPIRPDSEQSGSFECFPIINWTDDDVLHYLESKGLPTSGLYNEFGVSGCSWCPFFQNTLYYDIMKKMPNHYDRFIEWENRLNQPSVNGHIYLRDIKQAVLEGRPCPTSDEEKTTKSPCMMMFRGEMVQTCSIYGHLFIDGKCYRCEALEEKS